jgi:hypothetical protein
MVAGGYAWPPVANKSGVMEAGRLLGWSQQKSRRVYIAQNVLALALIPTAILGVVLGPS